jgi:hypothetical protein
MNRYVLIFAVAIVHIVLASFLLAQNSVPNSSFENWTGNTPDGWFANNPPSGPQTVVSSNDAHSGSFSAKLEVVEFTGFPFPPLLSAGTGGGFAVTERHSAVSGYYKFSPQMGDVITVTVQMMQGTNVIGTGFFDANSASSNWTQFTVPINYSGSGNPDMCLILIQVIINTSSGGIAQVDDIEFSSATNLATDDNHLLPAEFELHQNYPNPFNPSTVINFALPHQSDVQLELFDVVGKKISTLISENLPAGSYSYNWTRPAGMASGIYYYRLKTNDFVATRKMILSQ